MSMKAWPLNERPREKLIEKGPHALSDAELLAIFLRTGTPGKSALDLARDLLQSFGGLQSLLMANQSQFCQSKGVGTAKFVQLQAALEIARRHWYYGLNQGPKMGCPNKVRQFLISQLRDLKQEIFAGLFLNTRNEVISFQRLFNGTIDHSSVYPREIVRICLEQNAANIIFAHNHPSGDPSPSKSDIEITKHLTDALYLIDVSVIDHFIVGKKDAFSFKEMGLL